MDERAFGELSKRVAKVRSRRGVLAAFGTGVAAGLWGTVEEVEAAFGFCSAPQKPCQRNKKCCSGKCKSGKCTCNKAGAPCINKVGVVCCSQQCQDGKCA
jgi:hypothetical protein